MIIIVCIDDRGGMLFNRRRQSQDRLLRADILRLSQGKKLYMNSYSHALFQKDLSRQQPISSADFMISEDFFLQAGEGDFCFIENWTDFSEEAATDPSLFDRLEGVILYHWNRTYPADTYFTMDLNDENWELTEQKDFAGSSHEQITRKIYQKVPVT